MYIFIYGENSLDELFHPRFTTCRNLTPIKIFTTVYSLQIAQVEIIFP